MKKHRKIYNKEALWSARCNCCNYSNNLKLNDEALTETLGRNKKTRTMYYVDDKVLCSYCAYPFSQAKEVDEKKKTHLTDIGSLELEENRRRALTEEWNARLKAEGFLDI